jgi:hypothetical protein
MYNATKTTCIFDTGSDAIIFPEPLRLAILAEFFPQVVPLPGGREPIDCNLWTNVSYSQYQAVRLFLHGGNYIDWDIKEFMRMDRYYGVCNLLIAQGQTDEECDLSSNFLRIGYGEYWKPPPSDNCDKNVLGKPNANQNLLAVFDVDPPSLYVAQGVECGSDRMSCFPVALARFRV